VDQLEYENPELCRVPIGLDTLEILVHTARADGEDDAR
jgi:hypothetical protein